MCHLGKPTLIRWEVDPEVDGTHNMRPIYCNSKCIQTQRGGEAMRIGVSVYCENEDCEVEVYSKTVDQASAKQLNCPCCGQFGRTKGREHQSSRSIGLPPPETDPHD